MRLEGRLEKEDFGGVVWMLRAHDQTWHLKGVLPEALKGQWVVVEGEVEEQGFDFAMVGTPVRVRAVRPG